MSGSNICARGKHNGSTFILSCVRTVFSELPLHGRWLPAEHLRQYMHMKCNIGDGVNFTLPTRMMRVIKKVLLLVSLEPNIMEIPGNIQLRVFRFMFQNRTRRYFLWVTTKVGIIPSLPSQRNASAWEQDSVLTSVGSFYVASESKNQHQIFLTHVLSRSQSDRKGWSAYNQVQGILSWALGIHRQVIQNVLLLLE